MTGNNAFLVFLGTSAPKSDGLYVPYLEVTSFGTQVKLRTWGKCVLCGDFSPLLRFVRWVAANGDKRGGRKRSFLSFL